MRFLSSAARIHERQCREWAPGWEQKSSATAPTGLRPENTIPGQKTISLYGSLCDCEGREGREYWTDDESTISVRDPTLPCCLPWSEV